MPISIVEKIFTTNVFGPIRLTKGLLPRNAGCRSGSRRGRVESRSRQRHRAVSGVRGQQERARTMGGVLSVEIAPFGLGVSVLVAGTFKTDILELTRSWKDEAGPYAPLHTALESMGDKMVRFARRPDRFPPVIEPRPVWRRNRSPGMLSGPTLSQWNAAIGCFQRVGCSP